MRSTYDLSKSKLGSESYLAQVLNQHSELALLVDMDNIDTWLARRNTDKTNEFSSHGTMRGDLYRKERDQHPFSRPMIKELISLLETDKPKIIIDMMGGNGHIASIKKMLNNGGDSAPLVITSDAEHSQIDAALSKSLPAIRQPAQDTVFRSDSADAVLFAYGTHHIPEGDRNDCWLEARRILKTEGRIVIQDFETGTPTERWYSEVIHQWALTGHDYQHFTMDKLSAALSQSGFRNISCHYIDDSFVFRGKSEKEALANGIKHICLLFGLVKMIPDQDTPQNWLNVLTRLDEYFVIPDSIDAKVLAKKVTTYQLETNLFEAVFPRASIVVTGIK